MLLVSYRCDACARELAESALALAGDRSAQVRVCPTCRGPVVRETARIITPFWRQLLGAWVGPLRSTNALIVFGVVAISTLAGYSPLVGGLFAAAITATYFVGVISCVARGEYELWRAFTPQDDAYGRAWMWRTVLRMLSAFFVSFGPGLACSLAPLPLLKLIAPGVLGAGALFLPAALASVAVTERALWNPLGPLRMIWSVPSAYAQLVVTLALPAAFWVWVQYAPMESLAGRAVQLCAGSYALAVIAWKIGVLIREYWDDFND
jgi:hypothetical protein